MKRHTITLIVIILCAAVLRLYQLGTIPMGLFGDEVDAGYNAYSFLYTGRDYNGNFMPIHFESLGDYRAFLFIWSLVPTIAIFDLSPFSVRLAPALWGIAGILLIYNVVKIGLKHAINTNVSSRQSEVSALIATAMLAITPWHLHYSRAAFEVTLMIGLLLLAVYLFLKSLSNPKYLIAAGFIFALNAYSYNVAKVFSPMLFVITLLSYYPQLKTYPRKYLALATAVFVITLTPLAYDTLLGPGNNRFSSLNILNTPKLEGSINYSRGQSSNPNSIVTKLVHNKGTYLGRIFFDQYLNAFSPRFLFAAGQIDNPRHSLPGFGLFFVWTFPFFFVGLGALVYKLNNPFYRLTLMWLLAAPLPSSITIAGGEHATRLSPMMIPITIIIAVGIYQISTLQLIKPFRSAFNLSLISLMGVFMVGYLFNYYVNYSDTEYRWWNYGFQPAIHYAKEHESQYQRIIITQTHSSLPFLYYLFYSKYPPHLLHQQWIDHENDIAPSPDAQLGKYYFATLTNEDAYTDEEILYVATHWENTEAFYQVGSLPAPDSQETNPIFVYLEHNRPLLPLTDQENSSPPAQTLAE